MRDVQELRDGLEKLRRTIDEARETAEKLARDQAIHPLVPAQRRRRLPPEPTF